ncbi:hypothetical protein Tco_0937775 [Tanacetum coccineum]|uniref:Uncharacterized protein n=1 Tax=Tanacetum coccineum TaxID=301880 RepID=A0ABQ5DF76_9ASTR
MKPSKLKKRGCGGRGEDRGGVRLEMMWWVAWWQRGWRWWCGVGDEDGSGGVRVAMMVMVMRVVLWWLRWGGSRRRWRRVAASGYWGSGRNRGQEDNSLFRRENASLGKLSGDRRHGGRREGWPEILEKMEEEDDVCVSGKTEKWSGMSFYVKRWYTP